MDKKYSMIKMDKNKHIALIAHDNMKDDILEWAKENRDKLSKHFLYGTGTTAALISQALDLPIKAFKSGPLGGDQQIGARIAEGIIDFMIFFWDPLEAQPHDPDIKALLRIAALYDIPVATNRATADFLLSSQYMEEEYYRKILDFSKSIDARKSQFLKK
ncbi:MAG: methylglyoxal synthase [Tissierellia bacterium]|nr:methylglyoxal synthase [Tissierellia bacterium]